MSKPVTIPNTFATQSGDVLASQLDDDFSALQNAINDFSTYGGLYSDTGAVNALVVTIPAPLTFAYTGTPWLDVIVSVTNTSPTVTLNVNGLGAITIKDSSGASLTVGALVAGTMYRMVYDGTNFRALNSGTPPFPTNVVISPVSGVALTANLVSGQFGLVIQGDANAQYMMQLKSTSATNGRNAINFLNSGAVVQSWALGTDASGGSAGTFLLRNITAGTIPLQIVQAGNLTLAAPSSGTHTITTFTTNQVGLTVTDGINYTGALGRSTTVTNGFYVGAQAGNTLFLGGGAREAVSIGTNGNINTLVPVSGVSLAIAGLNNQNNATLFEGLNSINASKPISTYETGSFTGTLTGCGTSPTGSFQWSRNGNIVTIYLASALTASSTSGNMSITGMSAAITPAASQTARTYVTDNGTVKGARCTISGTTLTFDLEQIVSSQIVPTAASFTGSGVKGVSAGFSISFALT